jgi:hypothetical protein
MTKTKSTAKHSDITPPLILTTAAAIFLGGLSVQAQDRDDSAPVVIVSPTAWATLRSDSLTVSIQADHVQLPQRSIAVKVVRRSGSRSSTLFSKNVKVDEFSVDAFLGRVRDLPVGGTDFLSLEWSVTGSELKGVVEPIGVAKLNGTVSEDNKWVPAQPALSAVRLKDGVSGSQAAEALAGASGFEAGGYKFAAGWNNEGFYLLFTPEAGVTGVEFAFDLKCGKNAFLAWADRFIVYSADGDSIRGLHYGNRLVADEEMKFMEMAWNQSNPGSLAMTGVESARLISVQWPELGMQPFDERNVGFAVFVKGKTKKQPANYPAGAKRDIPGTWGDLRLEK